MRPPWLASAASLALRLQISHSSGERDNTARQTPVALLEELERNGAAYKAADTAEQMEVDHRQLGAAQAHRAGRT